MVHESILKYIDENLPVTSNKIELSYAIYILLLKVLRYSPKYASTKDLKVLPNPEDVTLENNEVICYTWSELYHRILNIYNINSRINKNNKDHHYVEIEEDNILIKADATKSLENEYFNVKNDLTNIRFGLEISFFRLEPTQKDRKEKNKYLEMIKNKVNKELNVVNEEKGIETFMNGLRKLDENERVVIGISFLNKMYKKDKGEVERRQLSEKFLPRIFNEDTLFYSIYRDKSIMTKKIIITKIDGETIIIEEDKDGFKIKNNLAINNELTNNIIRFKYEKERLHFYKLFQKEQYKQKIMI